MSAPISFKPFTQEELAGCDTNCGGTFIRANPYYCGSANGITWGLFLILAFLAGIRLYQFQVYQSSIWKKLAYISLLIVAFMRLIRYFLFICHVCRYGILLFGSNQIFSANPGLIWFTSAIDM
jgi:hypothetical protein